MEMLKLTSDDELSRLKRILADGLKKFPKQGMPVNQFNLLKAAGGNLNENAHTRILSALLQIKPVRMSFFKYLDSKYSARGLDKIVDAEKCGDTASVRCFENYIDACVRVGDCCVIIENKVKGACDQAEQIDRYVNSVQLQGCDKHNVFVLYVTQNGGEPTENSFRSAKDILDYNKCSSRFFAINYRQDILPWLYEMLGRKIWFVLERETEREMLQTGLFQYVNYIEGPALLNVQEVYDGFQGFRGMVISGIKELSLKSIMDICTVAEFMVLCQRQYICDAMAEKLFNKLHIEEKRRILKTIFYNAFGVVIPDTDFYRQLPVKIVGTDSMVMSAGVWEDIKSSLVQIDIWCADGGDEGYDKALNGLKDKIGELPSQGDNRINVDMTYNGRGMIRFRVASIKEIQTVISLLGGKIGQSNKADDATKVGYPIECDCEEWLLQIKAAIKEWCASKQITDNDARWDLWNHVTQEDEDKNFKAEATHSYWYVNDWAIQLYENPSEPMRAIDVFAKRGKGESQILGLLKKMASGGFPARALKWDGRVFLRFPTPTIQYAKDLLGALWEWRKEIKPPMDIP